MSLSRTVESTEAWGIWADLNPMWQLTVTVFASGATNSIIEPWGGLVALAGTLAAIAANTTDEPDDDLADAHRSYIEGEIDEAELEARVELALDPRADELRETVEQVNGVGPSTSAAIARRFESVEQVREASPSELELVNGVGPDRAEAINQRVR